MTQVTHKLIVVNDLNRELSPIGYGFQSPIYKPSKFPVDIIGQLLNVSRVTAMFEVFEKDQTLRVHLTNANFRKPFQEIWAEQNPTTPFPWDNGVEDVKVVAPVVPPAADQPPVDAPPADLTVTGTAVFTNPPVVPGDQVPQDQPPVVTDSVVDGAGEGNAEQTTTVVGDTDGDVVTTGTTEQTDAPATTEEAKTDADVEGTKAEEVAPAAETETKVDAPKAQQQQGNKYQQQQRRR